MRVGLQNDTNLSLGDELFFMVQCWLVYYGKLYVLSLVVMFQANEQQYRSALHWASGEEAQAAQKHGISDLAIA